MISSVGKRAGAATTPNRPPLEAMFTIATDEQAAPLATASTLKEVAALVRKNGKRWQDEHGFIFLTQTIDGEPADFTIQDLRLAYRRGAINLKDAKSIDRGIIR